MYFYSQRRRDDAPPSRVTPTLAPSWSDARTWLVPVSTSPEAVTTGRLYMTKNFFVMKIMRGL